MRDAAAAPEGLSPRLKTGMRIGAAVCAALAVWAATPFLPPQARGALSISALILGLWIGEPFPHAVTGVIGCYLFWAVARIPFSVAFSGFANTTPWFVLSAGLFGAMATRTGLVDRFADGVLGRSGMSYNAMLLATVLVSVALNLLVPSGIARVIILGVVALGVARSRGWDRDSVPGRGLFVTLTVASSLFDKMMITGGSSIVAREYLEKLGQTHVYWSQWVFAHVPTILLSIPACWLVAKWLFPYRSPLARTAPPAREWSSAERRCASLLGIAFVLWSTGFIHRIHPAMVALGIGLVAVLPGIGMLKPKDLREFDFLPFLFAASALSLGMALMESGALNAITGLLGSWSLLEQSFVPSALVLYWTGVAYHMLVPSDPATLATSMPALMQLAAARNWSPVATGLVWTLSLGGKLFVYQSGVSIAGYSFGYFKGRDFLRIGFWLMAVEFVILTALLLWYWPLIGLIR